MGNVFEGGQIPLSRRLPKFGFRSHLKFLKFQVNLSDLGKLKGLSLTANQLAPKGYGNHPRLFVTVAGTKAPKFFPKSIEAHKFSPKTREILESNGVTLTVKPHMDGAQSNRPEKIKKK